MKLERLIKFLNIVGTLLVLFVFTAIIPISKAEAADEPVPPAAQTPEQCIGQALAEYMNAITAAQTAGTIPPNIKLLSPAFNMTSPTFPGIVDGMKQAGADFSKIDSIAGNVYNVGGQNISYYMQSVRAAFPGKSFIITETGTFNHSASGIQDLASELDKLQKSGDIRSALLFNALGTNSGWNQHKFTDDEIRILCGGSCEGKKIGFNTANIFGLTPESYYQQAQSLGLSTSLEIADSGQINNTMKGLQNSINHGIRPIIRIGVGGSSGGFKDPATYASFLSQVGRQFPGVDIYAIAGPNEPDLENWLTPECGAVFVPVGEQCVGPVNVDLTAYRGQVIGHQDPSPDNLGPWRIYASATDRKEDDSDIVTSVVVDRMSITPTQYWHTDFSTVTQKYIGSLDTANPDFINTKVESLTKMDTVPPRSPPLYMTSHIPGYVYQGGFQIAPQAEKKGTSEAYSAFQARVYPSQDGKKPGTKSTIDGFNNTAFIGCLQSAVCDPNVETCLKNDKSGDLCEKGKDSAENCIGEGKLLKFQMPESDQIKLLEPQDLQAMDKVLWDFSASIADKPGDSVPHGRSNILATSLDDYFAQEKKLLAQANPTGNQLKAGAVPMNLPSEDNYISSSLKNANPINPTQAQAQTAPPYQESQPYCDGAHILIENKTAENQFSVKAWQADDGCPGGSDWGYDVQYYVVNKTGASRHVGGCTSPIHRSAEFAKYKPDGHDDEKYGIPLETLEGCSVPITPRDLQEGEELQVSFHQLGGRAPFKEGCNQHFYCECPSESACGVRDNKPLPPVDCTKCETWAPSGECSTMVAEDLLEGTQCAQGHCEINNGEFKLADDIDEGEKSVETGGIVGNLRDILLGWFSSATKIFNWNCEEEDDYTDPVTQVHHDGHWECTWGERQYLLYGYVPGRFKGKLNQFRTSDDFKLYQAMFKVPGISDQYFDPKPSKHELALKLSLGGSLKGGDGKTPSCANQPLGEKLSSLFGLGSGGTGCLDLNIEGSDTRSMYIEYKDHYSQAEQYCLSEAAGSLPNSFPERPAEFCKPILSELRGGSFLNSISSGSNLTQGTVNQLDKQALQLGVPPRLLATILDIEGGNKNGCYRPTNPSDTGTGAYQITDDLALSLTDETEQTEWNIKRWPAGTPQSVYRADGRCNFDIASQIAARALKQKAHLDPRTGIIRETDFAAIRDALNGFYGEYNGYCGPTDDTQGRWGTGISYCDKGLFEMGLTQYCTGGRLSPTCDNIGADGTSPGTYNIDNKQSEETTFVNKVFQPTTASKEEIQDQLASDLEHLLDKYSIEGGSFTMDTPVEKLPAGLQVELASLKQFYKNKYNL